MTASSICANRSNPSRAIDTARVRVALPQRDLRPERVEVDDELGVLDATGRRLGDLEMTSSGRQVTGPDRQVRQRDVQVDGADPRQCPGNVALEKVGCLGIARELDQHRGRVDLEEDPEAQLGAVPSRALDAGERDLERLLDESAHLEDGAEIGVGPRDRGRIVGGARERERSAQEVDAAGDVAERREVDAEDAHRPRFDPLVAQRTRRRDRSFGDRTRLAGPAGEHQVRREAGQHPGLRAQRRPVSRRPRNGVLGRCRRRSVSAAGPPLSRPATRSPPPTSPSSRSTASCNRRIDVAVSPASQAA